MSTLVGQYGAEAQLSSTGGLLTNTSVTVLTMGGAAASLFTDITGNTAAGNPVFTDSKGNLLFFAAPGQSSGNTYSMANASSVVFGSAGNAPSLSPTLKSVGDIVLGTYFLINGLQSGWTYAAV